MRIGSGTTKYIKCCKEVHEIALNILSQGEELSVSSFRLNQNVKMEMDESADFTERKPKYGLL